MVHRFFQKNRSTCGRAAGACGGGEPDSPGPDSRGSAAHRPVPHGLARPWNRWRRWAPRIGWIHRYGLPGMALLLLFLFPAPTHAQESSADEYAIRAAMLLNLTKFIDWPAARLDPTRFAVCILGQDPITPFADRYLQKQLVLNRPIQVEHLATLSTAQSCQMLYVGASARGSPASAYSELVKQGVLILSERSNADSPSQLIGLPSVDQHVHIEIDLGAAQRAGFTFSSKLLRLATVTR